MFVPTIALWFSVFAPVLAPNTVVATTNVAAPTTVLGSAAAPQRPAAVVDDPAFARVEDAYNLERQAYDQARVDAARGRGPAPTQHPAVKFWSRMEAVAASGSPRARRWLCENVGDGVVDPARRGAVLERELEALLACCPGGTDLFGPLTGVKTQVSVIGMEKALHLLERIAEGATEPEVQARALYEQAFLVSDRGRTTDPALRARASEIQHAVVLAFPTTRVAKEAADMLLRELQLELAGALDAWVDAALAAQAAGSPPEAWSANPLHAFQPRFETLAATGHPTARGWTEALFPSFLHSEKLATDRGLDSLVRDLEQRVSPRDPAWSGVLMRLLELAVRVGGGDAGWVRGAVTNLAKQVGDFIPLTPLPFTDAVLELATGSEARAQALWVAAQTRISERSEPQLLRALEDLDTIVANHPDMGGLVDQATQQAAALRQVMPGSVLPDSRNSMWGLKDTDDLELLLSGYRGRVLLVDVFDTFDSGFAQIAPERVALHERSKGRPLAIVGLCTSHVTLAAARESLAQLGIDYRVGLLQGETHPYLGTLFARGRPPTTILVDADGVIRARGRPFADMARLAEECTAELERTRAATPENGPK